MNLSVPSRVLTEKATAVVDDGQAERVAVPLFTTLLSV
jgi:hypothetical protein